MKARTAYENGRKRFVYYLAADAIEEYLSGREYARAYADSLRDKIRAGEGDLDDLLEEATGAANALVDKVRAANGTDFDGTDYTLLVAAAYDRLGIEH